MLVMNLFMILAPFAWGTGWWFGLKAITQDPNSWRNRASIFSLGIVTAAGLLWLPAAFYAAHSGRTSEHLRTIDLWSGVAILICAVALILSLFGRPRLILPIAVAALGTSCFWIGTTIP